MFTVLVEWAEMASNDDFTAYQTAAAHGSQFEATLHGMSSLFLALKLAKTLSLDNISGSAFTVDAHVFGFPSQRILNHAEVMSSERFLVISSGSRQLIWAALLYGSNAGHDSA